MGSLKTAADEPFAGRNVADLGEVALERSQAAPRIACYFVHRKVVHIVLVKEIEDVDFPWFDEIEQRGKQVLVSVEEDIQPLGHLQLQHIFRRLYPRIEIRQHRLEQTADIRTVA